MLKPRYNNSKTKRSLNTIRYRLLHVFYFMFSHLKYREFKDSISNCHYCHRYMRSQFTYCSSRCEINRIEERFQAFKHNNDCSTHKFDQLTYKGECWSCYRIDWLDYSRKIKPSKRLLLRFYGFEIIPTFRNSQEAWAGDRVVFEEFLAHARIKWFVYIKFYENKQGKIRPMVVGKSGSRLVNSGGSDLSFSTAMEHGPARKFINLNGFIWHYDCIAIKTCRTSRAAYKLERKIAERFDLFES